MGTYMAEGKRAEGAVLHDEDTEVVRVLMRISMDQREAMKLGLIGSIGEKLPSRNDGRSRWLGRLTKEHSA